MTFGSEKDDTKKKYPSQKSYYHHGLTLSVTTQRNIELHYVSNNINTATE